MKVRDIFNKVKFQGKKHCPEIMVVTGVIGIVASAVMACRATVKATKVVEEHKEVLNNIKDIKENDGIADENVVLTPEDIKKETKKEYVRYGLRLVKLYAVPVILGAASITSILFGHHILKKRDLSLAAAYATLDKSFKEYRKKVEEKYGTEAEREIRYNIKPEDIPVKTEDGKTETKTVKTCKDLGYSPYARFYEEGNTGWDDDPEMRLYFLRQMQNRWNDKLRARGYVFLNEVYESLGIAPTREGQIVGWKYNLNSPTGDNYIDFGIYNAKHSANGRFIEGIEDCIILDFNVDGDILNYMG